MTMPTWLGFAIPVLKTLSNGQVWRRRELYDAVAEATGLTSDERAIVLSSGNIQYENRIGWATSKLNRAGALSRPARGEYVITALGRKLLSSHPSGLSLKDLGTFQTGQPVVPPPDDAETADLDPTEQVEQGIAQIHSAVAAELLTRLHAKEPGFFEQSVVKLLVAMGYGGADSAATVTQLSNDGGIDGIIDQDTLGLNRVYVQAKRYALDTSVGRPELQAFVGALSGKADGGVFITTGRFSKGAREYSDIVPTRIILIDGERLAKLMIKFGVGVQVRQTVHIVEVDEDFFE